MATETEDRRALIAEDIKGSSSLAAAEPERVRELRELAESAAASARHRIRREFHERWGHYYKCARCGGRIDCAFDRHGPILSDRRCPHGDHDAEPVQNGYSWTVR